MRLRPSTCARHPQPAAATRSFPKSRYTYDIQTPDLALAWFAYKPQGARKWAPCIVLEVGRGSCSGVHRLLELPARLERERRPRQRKIRCRTCGSETSECPACGEAFRGAVEKGVDTALVTDLLSLAWQGAYDVAILVTSDADFIPAVEHVQAKGLKVVNAGWPGIGYELKAACWANFDIARVSGSLCRSTT